MPETRILEKNLGTNSISLSNSQTPGSLRWLILCVNVAGAQCQAIWFSVILDVSVRVFLDHCASIKQIASIV